MAESTEKTDPRYPAAYQRGYEGTALEVAPRGQERFRRPLRSAPAAESSALPDRAPARGDAGAADVGVGVRPARASGLGAPTDPASSLPTGAVEVEEDDPEGVASETSARPGPASLTRISIALAVMGAVLLLIGIVLLWDAASMVYTGNGTEFEQFTRALIGSFIGPSITIGLLAIGGAIALRAART